VGMVEEVGSAAQNLYVPPGGLEPPPLVPETSALSPELRGP
jgi:hypothetical protein